MPAPSTARPARAHRLNFFSALRGLASRWRRPWAAQASLAQPIGLGMGALPDGMERLPVGTPVALVARDAHSAALWFPALLADAVSNSSVFLLAPGPQWVDGLLGHPALHSAHAQGRLAVWLQAPGLQPLLRSQGLRPLLEELHSAGLRAHHALYVVEAQSLFTGLDMLPLQRVDDQLRLWCLQRTRPVVLACGPPAPGPTQSANAAPSDVLPLLRSLCRMAMPIATLSTGAEHTTVHFERWNSASGAVFHTGFGLALDAQTQQLRYDGSRTQGQDHTLVEAPDQGAVIATRAAIAQQPGVPPTWNIVDTLSDVATAAAHSIGATVLLDAGHSSEFEERARLVHHLRLTRPATLKIVVRENTGKLRSHSEQALLRLGANAVFYRELGFSRLLQLLQDLHNQSYVRPVNPDYQQALGAFLPAPVRGYQPAPEFSRLVRGMLSRTQDIGLGHSMVRLDIAPHIPHITALRACRMSRDGDLFTASHSAVYVFLFACREPDIEAALQRLFDVPLAQLFSAQSTDCSGTGMLALLEGLDTAARQGLPDYSSLLAPAAGSSSPPPAPLAAPGSPTAVRQSVQPAGTSLAAALPPLAAGPSHRAVSGALPPERPSLRAQPIGQRRTDRPAH